MKMKAALLATLIAGTALGQTETQIVPFDYDPNIDAAFPEFQMFDTLGGTRELVGLTLSYDQEISITTRLEQNSPITIAADNFFAEISYISLHQLGLSDGGDDDDDNGGPPFLGPGAAGASILAPELGPSDGYNGSGPDTYTESINSGMFNFTAQYDSSNQSYLDAFTGQGTLTTVLGGFSEIFGGYNTDPGFPDVDPNNPPDGPFFPFQDPFYGVFVELPSIRHQGTITATFEYQLVPTPATGTLLGLAMLGVTRRRR
ncbi:MAG: PEP-CTERM sorting domain-containing protein [Phycisphaera sp.]|nr:MAG: PEP-CTERM sorting domain-containing protein [Phycisphaera sp.]